MPAGPGLHTSYNAVCGGKEDGDGVKDRGGRTEGRGWKSRLRRA